MGKHEVLATESVAEKRAHRRAIYVDALVCIVAVLAAVVGCGLIWLFGGGGLFEQALLNVVGCAGVVISLVGVLLAYLIFRRQLRDSETTDRYQRKVLANLQQVLGGVDEKVTNLSVQQASDRVSDADAEQSTGTVDLWAKFTPESDDSEVYLNSPSGKRRRVYVPSAIPLAVIGALVKVWDEDGHTGRWTLGTLRGAFRAEGKGNHPWYLVFVPPSGETPILWKVTRGPGGTDHAIQVQDGSDFQ